MEPIKAPNLSLITRAHDNKWVALTLDYKKLLAVAESLASLWDKIGKNPAVVMHVLPGDVSYAPTIHS